MNRFLFCIFILITSTSIQAKVILSKVEYKSGSDVFEGILAFDSARKDKKVAVVVFHNWMGITSETESKITALAQLGHVAFAADLYGKGIRPKSIKEAGDLAGALKSNRKLLRDRVNLALNQLQSNKMVDSKKIFATGYCFGGTAALELARSGASILGVVSFHGGLSNPTPSDAQNIKAHVLIFHGALDPFVPADEVAAFKKEMDAAKIDYQFTSFSGAVHSFTEQAAGDDISKGAAYNKIADKRSWEGMNNFFHELSGK